jgi:hypothetical protein
MKLCIFLLAFLLSGVASSHPGEARVEIEQEKSAIIQAGQIEFVFQIVDTKLNHTVSDQDLNISHEKKLHMLIYDQSLQEFTHVHPEFTAGKWSVSIDLNVNGKYLVWAQGELAADGVEFSALSQIEVVQGKPAWPLPPVLSEKRSGTSNNSIVSLDSSKLRAGKMAMLDLTFSRADGTTPKITPYLGALAHVVATAQGDIDTLIHVHPMDGNQPNKGMLHVTFPNSGNYRLWVQFIDNGQLVTVPLVVNVL